MIHTSSRTHGRETRHSCEAITGSDGSSVSNKQTENVRTKENDLKSTLTMRLWPRPWPTFFWLNVKTPVYTSLCYCRTQTETQTHITDPSVAQFDQWARILRLPQPTKKCVLLFVLCFVSVAFSGELYIKFGTWTTPKKQLLTHSQLLTQWFCHLS